MHSIEDKESSGGLYGNELVINNRLVKKERIVISNHPVQFYYTGQVQ
jgi:hypothetical protein